MEAGEDLLQENDLHGMSGQMRFGEISSVICVLTSIIMVKVCLLLVLLYFVYFALLSQLEEPTTVNS